MGRNLLSVVLIICSSGLVWSQNPPSRTEIKAEITLFETERETASRSFASSELKLAESLAEKCRQELASENYFAARKLIRDARWNIPYLPKGMPAHVSKIFGLSRFRHGDRINSLSFSPDGKKLASASRDGTVRLWDLGNGRELITYRGHRSAKAPANDIDDSVFHCASVVFAPNGKMIASSGYSEVHLWNPETGELIRTLKDHSPKSELKTLAFFSDSKRLAGAGADKILRVWDTETGKVLLESNPQNNLVNSLKISRDGKWIATGNANGELYVYAVGKELKLELSLVVTSNSPLRDVALFPDGAAVVTAGGNNHLKSTSSPVDANGAGTTLQTYIGHEGNVNAVALDGKGELLVSGGYDRTVKVWDAKKARLLLAFQGHLTEITALSISPDGSTAASGSEDGNIKLWTLSANDDHRTVSDSKDILWGLAVSPSGNYYAAAGVDRLVRVYDAKTNKLLHNLAGHKGSITSLVFLDDDQLVTAGGDRVIKFWNLKTKKSTDITGHVSAILAVDYSTTSNSLVTGSADQTLRGWDLAAQKELWKYSDKSLISSVSAHPSKNLVAFGNAAGALTVVVVEKAQPKVVATVLAHVDGVSSVCWNAQGDRLATSGGDGMVRIFSLEEGKLKELQAFDNPIKPEAGSPPSPVTSVSFSPEGKYLVAGGAEKVLRVWDVTNGTEIRSLRGHADWITATSFSKDGSSVLSAAVDKTIKIFPLGISIAEKPSGHLGQVRSLAMSPEGRWLASGGEDFLIKIWDLQTGKEIYSFMNPDKQVPTAMVFVGNDVVVVGDPDGKLKYWEIKSGKNIKTTLTQPVMSLASDAQKNLAVAWASSLGKESGFELFPQTGATKSCKSFSITSGSVSRDALWGLSGGDQGTIRIWDLTLRERIGGDWELFKNAVGDLAVTPDRKTLVAMDIEGNVKIAAIEGRKVTHEFSAISEGVQALIMAPTGKTFLTLSVTGKIKAWDLSGKMTREWQLPVVANTATFSLDGKKVYTANVDGTIYVLDMP